MSTRGKVTANRKRRPTKAAQEKQEFADLCKILKRVALAAYHEAGHAVAACCLDLPFKFVNITPSGDSMGIVQGPDVEAPDDVAQRHQLYERILIVTFSGPVAQAKYLESAKLDWNRGRSDLEKATSLISLGNSRTLKESHAYLKYIWTRACTLVDCEWATITKVAQELMQKRELEFAEVNEIVGPTRPLGILTFPECQDFLDCQKKLKTRIRRLAIPNWMRERKDQGLPTSDFLSQDPLSLE